MTYALLPTIDNRASDSRQSVRVCTSLCSADECDY